MFNNTGCSIIQGVSQRNVSLVLRVVLLTVMQHAIKIKNTGCSIIQGVPQRNVSLVLRVLLLTVMQHAIKIKKYRLFNNTGCCTTKCFSGTACSITYSNAACNKNKKYRMFNNTGCSTTKCFSGTACIITYSNAACNKNTGCSIIQGVPQRNASLVLARKLRQEESGEEQ
jgi:hypothetical protein